MATLDAFFGEPEKPIDHKAFKDVEKYADTVFERSQNMLIPHYLMASYLYYVEDKCLFSDAYYDQLCKTLHKKLDKIDHRHKHLVDKAALKAGTGFHLKQDDYPTITKNSARSLLKHFGEHK